MIQRAPPSGAYRGYTLNALKCCREVITIVVVISVSDFHNGHTTLLKELSAFMNANHRNKLVSSRSGHCLELTESIRFAYCKKFANAVYKQIQIPEIEKGAILAMKNHK